MLAHDQHPADALGEALGRIDALLIAMEAMFDAGREEFAVHQSYVFHSLLTLHGIVAAAHASHVQLLDTCDLTMRAPLETGEAMPQDEGAMMEAEPELPAHSTATSKAMSGVRFVEDVTAAAANQDSGHLAAEAQPRWQPQQQAPADSGFAQSYLELLRKLTAAEIFAAEQQALAPPGTQQQLLPLLRSLREDFQKLHSAA